MIRVAINGFGRIGRNTLRTILSRRIDVQVVAVNDLADSRTLAHLFKYDSVHGLYPGEVQSYADRIVIDNHEIAILCEREGDKLHWERLVIEVVIESTGCYTSEAGARKHLDAGAL